MLALLTSFGQAGTDVAAISETWTTSDDDMLPATRSMIERSEFDIVMRHRHADVAMRGGGCALLIRKRRFSHTVVRAPKEPLRFEYVAARLSPNDGGASLVVMSIYIPPESAKTKAEHDELRAELACTTTALEADALCGDFNARDLTWDSADKFNPDDHAWHRGSFVKKALMDDCGFFASFPTSPTCFAMSGSIIDGAFFNSTRFACDDACATDKSSVLAAFSDHAIVHHAMQLDDIISRPPPSAEAAQRYRYRKIRHDKLTPTMIQDFRLRLAWLLQSGQRHSTSSRQAAFFQYCVHEATNMLCLASRSNSRPTPLPPELVASHDAALAASMAYEHAVDHRGAIADDAPLADQTLLERAAALRTAADAYREACRSFAARRLVAATEDTIKSELAAWRALQQILTPVAPNCDITHSPGKDASGNDVAPETWSNDEAKARGFLDVFTTKSARRPGQKVEPWSGKDAARTPGAVAPITRAEMWAAICAHDTTSSPDPDGFDAQLLRLFPEQAVDYLMKIGDTIFSTAKWPKQWKDSDVSPLKKPKGDATRSQGYRPVANTSILCRTIERVFDKRVRLQLKLSPEQFGFREGCSAREPIMQLLMSTLDGFANNCTAGHSRRQFRTLLLLLDFSDAFCRVIADDVARQFETLGGDKNYTAIIYDFLIARRHRVRVGSFTTAYRDLDFGTPQGSVLGPLCWLLVCEAIIAKVRVAMRNVKLCNLVGYASAERLGRSDDSYKDTLRRDPFNGFFFYADDSAIWATGYDAALLRDYLEHVGKAMHDAAFEFGIEISPKSTAMLFIRRTATGASKNITKAAAAAAAAAAAPATTSSGRPLAISKAAAHAKTLQERVTFLDTEKQMLASKDFVIKVGNLSIPVVTPSDAGQTSAGGIAAAPLEKHNISLLGFSLDHTLKGDAYITRIQQSAERFYNVLRAHHHLFSPATCRAIYVGKLMSSITYLAEVVHPLLSETHLDALEHINNMFARHISGCMVSTPNVTARALASLPTIRSVVHARQHKFIEHLLARPDVDQPRRRFLLFPSLATSAGSPFLNTDLRNRAVRSHPLSEAFCAISDTLRATYFPSTDGAGRLLGIVDDSTKSTPPSYLHPDRLPPSETGAANYISFLLNYNDKRADLSPEEMLESVLCRIAALRAAVGHKAFVLFMCDAGCKAVGNGVSAGYAVDCHHVDADGTPTRIDKYCDASYYGDCACSYSAEAAALLRMSELAAALSSDPAYDGLVILCGTDSLGNLQQLALGPIRQRETRQMLTWRNLLKIGASSRAVILFFVRAHCGFPMHDAVDARAGAMCLERPRPDDDPGKAAEMTALDEAVRREMDTGRMRHPAWWIDRARDRARNFTAASDAEDVVALSNTFYGRSLVLSRGGRELTTADLRPPPLRLNRALATVINRMRSGTSMALGGYRFRTVDPCPFCDTALSRDEGFTRGIDHFGKCDDVRARAARITFFGSPLQLSDVELATMLHDTDCEIAKLVNYHNQFEKQRLQLHRRAELEAAGMLDEAKAITSKMGTDVLAAQQVCSDFENRQLATAVEAATDANTVTDDGHQPVMSTTAAALSAADSAAAGHAHTVVAQSVFDCL